MATPGRPELAGGWSWAVACSPGTMYPQVEECSFPSLSRECQYLADCPTGIDMRLCLHAQHKESARIMQARARYSRDAERASVTHCDSIHVRNCTAERYHMYWVA
jgi:hypothetical protein